MIGVRSKNYLLFHHRLMIFSNHWIERLRLCLISIRIVVRHSTMTVPLSLLTQLWVCAPLCCPPQCSQHSDAHSMLARNFSSDAPDRNSLLAVCVTVGIPDYCYRSLLVASHSIFSIWTLGFQERHAVVTDSQSLLGFDSIDFSDTVVFPIFSSAAMIRGTRRLLMAYFIYHT